MLRIALVNLVPKTDIANYLGFNHGLGSISAVLKQDGHRTALFVFASPDDDTKRFEEFCPDLVYVYLTTNQYSLFVKLIGPIFAKGARLVFVGGPHPAASPLDTLTISGVSGICIGEGETAARLIAERFQLGLGLHGIPNVWFVENDKIIQNTTGDFAENLDELPFPDRSIFPYSDMLRASASRVMGFEFLATRGCVYGCRYCINPLWRKLHGKGCVRRRSASRFIEEIRTVTEQYAYRGIVGFHDDIFTLDPEWLSEFCSRYPKEIGLPFWCNAHVSNLNEDIIDTLAQAGCFRVHMGIECGSEETRSRLLNKRLTNKEILDKINLLKRHRMKIVTTFMIGLPDETEDDILQSVALCRAIAPDWVLLSVFCPYPGTSMYDDLVSQQKLDPFFYKHLETDTFYSAVSTYHQGTLKSETLRYYFDNFRRLSGVRG
jgi:radical SAM superfamily enzyme YgiQ (UPF0313 family)